nr:protein RETICULATA-RELATED 4, chloroplastic-like [Ipomoea batatas]
MGSVWSFLVAEKTGSVADDPSDYKTEWFAAQVGTVVTNTLINARKAVDKSSAEEVENVPVLSTSVAYGVYMAVSSNLRYQVLAGVIEQRLLEPMLHQHKLILSALCFAVRTGNTFLGSLLWVDYARWIGIQKAEEVETHKVQGGKDTVVVGGFLHRFQEENMRRLTGVVDGLANIEHPIRGTRTGRPILEGQNRVLKEAPRHDLLVDVNSVPPRHREGPVGHPVVADDLLQNPSLIHVGRRHKVRRRLGSVH